MTRETDYSMGTPFTLRPPHFATTSSITGSESGSAISYIDTLGSQWSIGATVTGGRFNGTYVPNPKNNPPGWARFPTITAL
jgi:hypothetical protein